MGGSSGLVHVADEESSRPSSPRAAGWREALAVETEATDRTIVEHQRVVAVIGGSRRGVLRLDDEGAKQPFVTWKAALWCEWYMWAPAFPSRIGNS